VRGYRPSFRLAARQNGRLVIFEADTNPRARVGRDLLDLQGKVRRISISSRADGTTELGAITDPGQAASMLRMLLAGPVAQRIQPAAEQPGRLLAFHLRDGTATIRRYLKYADGHTGCDRPACPHRPGRKWRWRELALHSDVRPQRWGGLSTTRGRPVNLRITQRPHRYHRCAGGS
jgi:hypothetical protein